MTLQIKILVNDSTYLETLLPEHAQALFDLVNSNRTQLRLWLPWLDQTRSVADQSQFILSSQEKQITNGAFDSGIWYQGELVGVVGMHPINWANRLVGIGYWLDQRVYGNGIATAAAGALCHYIFTQLQLNRVEIRCATMNIPSQQVAERLSFACEGIIHDAEWLYDHFVDHFLYAMLSSEWRSLISTTTQ